MQTPTTTTKTADTTIGGTHPDRRSAVPVRTGALTTNHNERPAVPVRTGVRAGGMTTNHNERRSSC